MTTATHDWVPDDMPNGQDRASSPFREQLTRVKAHTEENQPSWQFGEKSLDDMIAIPRQTLQKIYLSPPIDVRGDFRNIFVRFTFRTGKEWLLMVPSRPTRHPWALWASS